MTSVSAYLCILTKGTLMRYRIKYLKNGIWKRFNVDNLEIAIDIYIALSDSFGVKETTIEPMEDKNAN